MTALRTGVANPKGTTVKFTSETHLDDGVVERAFRLGDVPGILWMPASTVSSSSLPLILIGHPGGLGPLHSRLLARARSALELGFAAVALELPWTGERPRSDSATQIRAELREVLEHRKRPSEGVIDRLILPLVEQAVPEWQAALDALEAVPGLRGPVAISGGPIAIGTRLARVEPRIAAAGLFAGSYILRATIEEARDVTVPLHVLLQWDDAGNDRERALELFDAFGSTEKTLQANLGGHTGIPRFAAEDAGRFFVRHLA